MARFMCIVDCVISNKTSDGKPYPQRWKAGQVFIGKTIPNHHFVSMEPENQGKDVYDILKDKLEATGVYVDDEMTVPHLQKLLAEKRAEKRDEDEMPIIKALLDKHEIKYHHKTGINKLLALIHSNGLEEDLKKAKTKEV